MVIVVGDEHILDEADSILYISNTLGKGTNPAILPPAIDK